VNLFMSEKPQSFNVGVDIAQGGFVAELMDDEGKRIAKGQTLKNNLLGADKLEKVILDLSSREGYTQCRAGQKRQASTTFTWPSIWRAP